MLKTINMLAIHIQISCNLYFFASAEISWQDLWMVNINSALVKIKSNQFASWKTCFTPCILTILNTEFNIPGYRRLIALNVLLKSLTPIYAVHCFSNTQLQMQLYTSSPLNIQKRSVFFETTDANIKLPMNWNRYEYR